MKIKIIFLNTLCFGHLSYTSNVYIAYDSAATAIDNDFAVSAKYGLVDANTAYSAYQVYSAYKTDGPAAAIKQLGVEVVTTDVGKVAGYIVGKSDFILYPTAEAAVKAIFKASPKIKIALDKIADKIIMAAAKLDEATADKISDSVCKPINHSGFNRRRKNAKRKTADLFDVEWNLQKDSVRLKETERAAVQTDEATSSVSVSSGFSSSSISNATSATEIEASSCVASSSPAFVGAAENVAHIERDAIGQTFADSGKGNIGDRSNVVNKLKHEDELSAEDAGILDAKGKLTQQR